MSYVASTICGTHEQVLILSSNVIRGFYKGFFFFDKAIDLLCFLFHAVLFKSLFAACFKLCKLSFVQSVHACVRVPVCVYLYMCVCMCACERACVHVCT